MFDRSRYKTGYYPVVDPAGDPRLLVVVKRTYTIDVIEARCEVADEQDAIALGDEYDGDPDPFQSPLRYEADIAPWKVNCDVIFLGKAYAPGGKPATEWDVTLRVGGQSRTLRIFGPRTVTWVPPGKAKKNRPPEPQPPRISKPSPVAEVELSYRNAYGGIGTFYPEDPAAFRRAVRKEEKKREKKQKEEAAAAVAAAEAKAAVEDAGGEGQAQGTSSFDIRNYFFHGVKDIADAPEEELEIEMGSRRLKSSGGTVVLDLAELWEAEQREAELELHALRSAVAPDAAEAQKDFDGTERAGTQVLAMEAAALTEEYLEERREYEAARKKDNIEGGTRSIARADEGDEVLADGAWIEAQRRERARFYESLGLDPDDEIEWQEGEFPRVPCPTNFIGKGFALRNCKESLDGLEMPQIEDPARLIQPEDLPVDPQMLHLPVVKEPAGFGIISRSWSPRSSYAGFLPSEIEEQQERQDKQLVELDPEDPDQLAIIQATMDRTPQPMDPRVHNAASACWQLSSLSGDEDIFLENLDASGKTYFKLPGSVPYTRLERGEGWERVDVVLDTLVIDREAEKLWMVWRGSLKMNSLDELESYPEIDIDIQDMGVTEWRDLLLQESLERRRRAGEALKLGVDEVTDAQLAEFEEKIEHAGTGFHGIREERKIDARESKSADGTMISIEGREDVIMSDDAWIEQARLDGMSDDERREWELLQNEKAALADKKQRLKKRVEEIEREKALEAEAEAKKKKKKKKAMASSDEDAGLDDESSDADTSG